MNAAAANAGALVDVRGLSKRFDVSAPWLNRVLAGQPRQFLQAVDDVSFTIARGQTLALVGESGCGKSTLARLLVGLYTPSAGQVLFDGHDMAAALQRRRTAAALRRRLQMVFQDPYASLNPRWRVRELVAEPLVEQRLVAGAGELAARVAGLLQAVGLDAADMHKWPHQFSGGQRQRIAIARALASQPEFLVLDEPTSALDVSVQAQVLNLLQDLQHERGLTYLFISHNLAVVRHVSHRVGVMYLGRVVELVDQPVLFSPSTAAQRHPYTRLLLDAVPDVRMRGHPRAPLQGELPNPLAPPRGCAFHPRCPLANARCRSESPALRPFNGAQLACHAAEEGRLG